MVDTQALQLILDKKKGILSGNADKIDKQRSLGKMTAKERIVKLLDADSFVETDALLCDSNDYAGVVTGSGTINGRLVYTIAQDFTVHGGAMGLSHANKINKVLDLALKTGAPIILILDSAGVRIDEGATAMNAFSSIAGRLVRLSGFCPIISIVAGPAIGGASMLAQVSDITIAVEKECEMTLYGPTVIGSLTGKTLKIDDIGGASVLLKNGGVSLVASNEAEAFLLCAKVLDYLPECCFETTEVIDSDDMNRLIAVSEDVIADDLIREIVDRGEFLELNSEYGKALKTVFCRIGGHSCGLICCDPQYNDSMIDTDSALKASRFIRFLDCFDIPIVTLINSKGIAVPDAEHQTFAMKAASSLMFSYAEATSPKVSVITGNAIGQSFIALSGKEQADMIYAWPGAIISALTPDASVQVLYSDRLQKGESRFELETAFATEEAGAFSAACSGLADDVINPAETRKYIIRSLEMLESKAESAKDKKHGNLPI